MGLIVHNFSNQLSHVIYLSFLSGFSKLNLFDLAIKISKENNKSSIQLDIRETQSAAIQLFESKGFSKWGENPSYAFINGNRVKGYYYYKDL